METSKKGIKLIAEFEGFSSKPYLCPAGVPTIGYGTTIYPSGTHVEMSDKAISKEQAMSILKYQVDRSYGATVNRYVQNTDITQNQFDAMVSFTYNLGSGNLKSSTLLKRVNQGKMSKASKEFLKWDKAGGRKLAGLTRRRQAESALFLA